MSIRPLFGITVIITFGICLDAASAQTIISDDRNRNRSRSQLDSVALRPMSPAHRAGFSLMPASTRTAIGDPSAFPVTPMAAAAQPQVVGSGTLGRLTKWTGFGSSNSVIGNSTIFEDKFGMVGIGTDTPTSRLTVAGTIQSLSGGFRFPDGTVQTTSATGGLFSVSHNATLVGDGTSGSPLGVAVPLFLNGAVGDNPILTVSNTAEGAANSGGAGIVASGGNSNSSFGFGGFGVSASGGNSISGPGGPGLGAFGGTSDSGNGGNGMSVVGGNSNSGDGGKGLSAFGGFSASGFGGDGITASPGNGPLGNGLAGSFEGDVEVFGMLSKGGGSFKIDHPLDPENRYLKHSFVESPDMMNIYNGNITTDDKGEAVVSLPQYFEALNQEFRYQLTVVGTFAQAIVATKVKDNRFVIRTSAPGVEVSWQVTGIRHDPWARKNRISVEVEKTDRERGYYLHPEAFDQPEELSIQYLRHPEMMKKRKDAREQASQKQ
jgi:hypothetical protein